MTYPPLQYMFVTEVDSSKKRGVHDELARLLVQCLRQQDPLVVPKLLDVSATSSSSFTYSPSISSNATLPFSSSSCYAPPTHSIPFPPPTHTHLSPSPQHLWFFLEVMLKSMAQYLTITKKMAVSTFTFNMHNAS